MPTITPEQAGGLNRCALLDCIAYSEIGTDLLAKTDDGYNVLVGSTPSHILTFPSYADHPNVYNAALKSDAAGRYQIMKHWWPAYKIQLHLPDFGKLSQDIYAIQQIRESHALNLIDLGHFGAALTAIAHIWASIPGAGYGQHENSFESLPAAYLLAGGTINS
jgi:muramidase (phage lysozyme)